jgi:hypothetical protein
MCYSFRKFGGNCNLRLNCCYKLSNLCSGQHRLFSQMLDEQLLLFPQETLRLHKSDLKKIIYSDLLVKLESKQKTITNIIKLNYNENTSESQSVGFQSLFCFVGRNYFHTFHLMNVKSFRYLGWGRRHFTQASSSKKQILISCSISKCKLISWKQYPVTVLIS